MTASTISIENQVTNFQKDVINEYVRKGKFSPYIGDNQKAIIQVNRDLQKHSIPLVAKLKNSGVRGSGQLVGSEEALSNYAFTFQPTHIRHGVLIDNEEREKSKFDLFEEARPSLMTWFTSLRDHQIIQALGAIQAGGTYFNYGGSESTGAVGSSAASAANLDAWNTANADRIVYGSNKANIVVGDHTASLATIDTTNDKLSTDSLTLLKRIASDADPLIRPVEITGEVPVFIYFVGKYGFRDLQRDPAMQNALREARERGITNPLFAGGDLKWDNIIIKEIEDLDKFIDSTGSGLWDGIWGARAVGDNLKTAGAAASRVGVGFLCGAQAICFGIGKEPEFKLRKEDDYGHLSGVAVTGKHDIKKMFFNGKQHGMITHFHSATLD